MSAERVTFFPVTEDPNNAPLEVVDRAHGITLLEHSYGSTDVDQVLATSVSVEGDRSAGRHPKSRPLAFKFRVFEPPNLAAVDTTNLVANPSYEQNLTGAAASNAFLSGTSTISQILDFLTPDCGDYALKCVTTATANMGVVLATVTLTGGQPYAIQVAVRQDAGGSTQHIVLAQVSAPNTEVFIANAAAPSATGYTVYSAVITPATTGSYIIYSRNNAATVSTTYFDGVSCIASSTIEPYFDGDTIGCFWTGARHASTSTRRARGGKLLEKITSDVEKALMQMQREGGTIRRILPQGDPITFDVFDGTMQTPADLQWMLWNRGEVDLTMSALPYGRGAEYALSTHSETALPVLRFTETVIKGNAPALGRLVLTDLQGADQYAAYWGIRSRYYDSSADAALFYEAETRTPLNGAATAAGTGASGAGSNVVRSATLTPSTLVGVLSTQAAGGGNHLRHVGDYQVLARCYPASANGGTVSVALDWCDGTDFRKHTLNPLATVPVPSQLGFSSLRTGQFWADLGQVHLTKAVAGAQGWLGRVLAKSTVAGDTVDVDCLLLVPVSEASGRPSAVVTIENPATFTGRDEFAQTAGALNGKTAANGGAWTSAGPLDFQVDGNGGLNKPTTDNTNTESSVLGAALTAQVVQCDVMFTQAIPGTNVQAGIAGRFTSATQAFFLTLGRFSGGSPNMVTGTYLRALAQDTTGNVFLAYNVPFTPVAGAWYTLRLQIDVNGRFWCWLYTQGGAAGQPAITGQVAALATGGTLASGKGGIWDSNAGAAIQRNWDNFMVYAPTSPDAAIFASRALEIRSDRVIRDDPAGTTRPRIGRPEGDYLRIPPTGREGRTLEVVAKGFRNDPLTMPDTGIDDLQGQLFVTPRYGAVPEP